MSEVWPTADDVARACIAAALEARVDPVAIITGEECRGGPHGNVGVARARMYAALALDELFEIGAPAASRLVGATSYESHIASFKHRLRNKTSVSWYNPHALFRVKRAVRPDNVVKLQDTGRINLRKKFVGGENVTGRLMGDPRRMDS